MTLRLVGNGLADPLSFHVSCGLMPWGSIQGIRQEIVVVVFVVSFVVVVVGRSSSSLWGEEPDSEEHDSEEDDSEEDDSEEDDSEEDDSEEDDFLSCFAEAAAPLL